jgi:hypothetical protein
MDKSQRLVRRGFLLGLLPIFLFFGWWASQLVPTEKEKAKAKVLETIGEERSMGESLEEKILEVGRLTNIPSEFILNPFHPSDPFANHTNTFGALIDGWQTPFQIKFAEHTNFIIYSAGPNKIFGDTDDIIFNSVSNDFVKP